MIRKMQHIVIHVSWVGFVGYTFDENRRSVGILNPMRDKNEGTYRGGGRDDTYDHDWSRR